MFSRNFTASLMPLVSAGVLGAALMAPVQADEAPLPSAAAQQTPAPAAPTPPAPIPPAPDPATQERLRQLEEQVRKLTVEIQRLKDAQKPEAVEKVFDERLKKQKPAAGFTDQGFAITSADGNNQFRFRSLLQADFRGAARPSGRTGPDSFSLRRVRPTFDGTLQKYVDFRIQPDFAQGMSVIQDAYLQLNYFPSAQVRVGKFKGPFSLEFTQGAGDITFVERSLSNGLSPLRDVGIQVGGEVLGGRGQYQFGLFNGTPDTVLGDFDTGNDKEVYARVFATPWKPSPKSPLSGLGLGVGLTVGSRDEAAGALAYRTASRTPHFRYLAGTTYDGRAMRIAPQLHYYRGSFGLMSEFITSKQRLRNGASAGEVDHRGWFVHASYILTGEENTYRTIVPRQPFDPKNRTWGAFEIAARYSRLDLDNTAFARGFADPAVSVGGGTAWTIGVNWYLNRALKLQLNYERTDFDRAVTFGPNFTDHEDVFLARFQIAF